MLLEDNLEKLLKLLNVDNEEDAIEAVAALAQPPIGVVVLVNSRGGIQISSIGSFPMEIAERILLEGIRVIANNKPKEEKEGG